MKRESSTPCDVSIVIPTYNRSLLVQSAIGSCVEAAPTASLQVIVVDDASTDDTAAVLAASIHGIEVLRLEENRGQSHARNFGIQRARGDYLKFLDSDDVLEPGALADELALARSTGASLIVAGWGEVTIDAAQQEVPGSRRTYPPPDMSAGIDAVLAGRAVPTSAALYRRKDVAGLSWDPTIRKLDDWDWFCQAALRGGTIAPLARTSYWMRSHSGARATDASMLTNARDHHAILGKIARTIAARGELTHARQLRLAQYYYKELRVLSLHDRQAFDSAVEAIDALDPHFRPRDEERQMWMRALARLMGFRRAVLLHSLIKKSVKRMHLEKTAR